MLKDFINYARDEFDLDIIATKSENPDTYEKIFGDVMPQTLKQQHKYEIEI